MDVWCENVHENQLYVEFLKTIFMNVTVELWPKKLRDVKCRATKLGRLKQNIRHWAADAALQCNVEQVSACQLRPLSPCLTLSLSPSPLSLALQ